MIAALSSALIERGNVPALITIGPAAEDIANASRQLLRYRAEATVFLSGSPPESLVELTRRNGQTLILINRAETDLDSVRCDDRDGVRQAFEALRATGASRFGVVNAANPSPSLLTRERFFADFVAAEGAELSIARAGHSDYAGGQEAARRLLAEGNPPQAVFCVNDSMAIGALDFLRSAGLSVPEDISIVGFDDLPMAAWAPYRLTTVRQDPGRIAKEVVALLDRRAADPELAADVRALSRRSRRSRNRQGASIKAAALPTSVDDAIRRPPLDHRTRSQHLKRRLSHHHAVQLSCARSRPRSCLWPPRLQPSLPGKHHPRVPGRQGLGSDERGDRRRSVEG